MTSRKLQVAFAAVALMTLGFGEPVHAERPAGLLFWSGFEGELSVGKPRDCYNAGCWQDLVGTDSATGFTWPPRIAGGKGAFQMRSGAAASPETISDYIVNEI